MLSVIGVSCPNHKKAIILGFNAKPVQTCRFPRAQTRNLNPMELSELSRGTVAGT